MSNFTRRFVYLLTLAALTNALHAVDGVILIDQARAMAGNVTPGDTPGFPILITVPGSYRLSANLTIPDRFTNGIQITADNVTIDLNGFSIIGPTVCTPNPTNCGGSGGGVGIHSGDFNTGTIHARNIRVYNGTVRGMGFHGVRLMGDTSLVENVFTYSNGGPGIVVGGGSVINSFAVLNGGTGIIAAQSYNSVADRNASTGISIRQSGIAIGNRSTFNGGAGLTIFTGTAANNTVTNNGGFGIDATCPAVLTANVSIANSGGNYRFTGSCTILSNTP